MVSFIFFECSPLCFLKISNLTSIFFRWVGKNHQLGQNWSLWNFCVGQLCFIKDDLCHGAHASHLWTGWIVVAFWELWFMCHSQSRLEVPCQEGLHFLNDHYGIYVLSHSTYCKLIKEERVLLFASHTSQILYTITINHMYLNTMIYVIPGKTKTWICYQWLFLVPVKGGIGGIVHPPIGRVFYHIYIYGIYIYIYCLLGVSKMLPIPPFTGTRRPPIDLTFLPQILGPNDRPPKALIVSVCERPVVIPLPIAIHSFRRSVGWLRRLIRYSWKYWTIRGH